MILFFLMGDAVVYIISQFKWDMCSSHEKQNGFVLIEDVLAE